MLVGSGHALHIVCAAVAADDFRLETAWPDHSVRRRVELKVGFDFLLHHVESRSVNDGRVIVPYVISRQLSHVLDNLVRPMVFREVSLQNHIPGVDRVLQDVAHKVYGAGVAVLFQPLRCLPHGDVLQEILVNPPNGCGFLLVDDEGLAVPVL